MKYYVIDKVWSQTDRDTTIVMASSKEDALKFLSEQMSGYAFLDLVRTYDGKIRKAVQSK
jgi:hypothetical protein